MIMQLTKGALLQEGKYTIESVLGQGSFGITYLATTKFKGSLGDISVKVAIKEFFARDLNLRHPDGTVAEVSSGSLSGKYAKDFQREVKNLSSLKHPNIINVLEDFSENNTHYYVMEYLEGGNLDDYIQSKGRLSEDEALDIASQMTSALSYMHSNNMLHLDLKPKNVMRRSDGTICLIDFGLSKQYESSGEPESSTTIGLGTPGYAPLEQGCSDERKNFAPTLDVYAFGASIFKMLTGKTPPRASDIMNDGFPSEELEALGVSPETIARIERMMSPRKKDRPQRVEECGLLVGMVHQERNTATIVEDTEVLERKNREDEKSKIYTSEKQEQKKAGNREKLVQMVICCIIGLITLGVISFYNRSIKLPSSECVEASYLNGILTVNGIEYPMVDIEGGTFMMGSQEYDDEYPIHKVTISSYSIGKYEVTQELWKAVMNDSPNYYRNSRQPIEASYDDCITFIQKLNTLTGLNFKLPTEAQWEYAARGGNLSKGHEYSGSSNLGVIAWSLDNSSYSAQDVGLKSPNELGIHDMSGNVWEWCCDWYGKYSLYSQTNPVGPSEGTKRVARGGGAKDIAWNCRVSVRYPVYDGGTVGMRLCL